jgi:hypothetical protein
VSGKIYGAEKNASQNYDYAICSNEKGLFLLIMAQTKITQPGVSKFLIIIKS